MCGIAGFSLSPRSTIDRTLATRALLAGIAERGADAVGYAHRRAGEVATVHKQRSGATALLERVQVASDATEVLVHVRDYTKGHPTVAANNHPIRHGNVVGIHNGIILNDEQVLAVNGFLREEPGMTVDSEAIFAVADAAGSDPKALQQLRGSMAAAWLDDRYPDVLLCARGVGRPLWLGRSRRELFFASTERALQILSDFLRLRLDTRELEEGTLVTLCRGQEVRRERFQPDRSFEETPLPAVRAPHEGVSCLQRLATLALG